MANSQGRRGPRRHVGLWAELDLQELASLQPCSPGAGQRCGWLGRPTVYAVQWLDTALPLIRGEAVDAVPSRTGALRTSMGTGKTHAGRVAAMGAEKRRQMRRREGAGAGEATWSGGARRGAEGSGRSAQERARVRSSTATMWPFQRGRSAGRERRRTGGAPMHIEHRDSTPKYPHAIREDRTLDVLNWLLEFEVSSFELLARLLGMRTKTSYKLFRALLAEKVIQLYNKGRANVARCFLLTRCGATQLHNAGRDISNAATSPASVTDDVDLVHALAVQAAVLPRLPQYDEVIWKSHITLPEPLDTPDVLLRSPQGAWVALDYERRRKDDNRIYMSFRNHAEAIMAKHYRGVFLLFGQPADLEHYRTLFDAEAWPEYDYHRKTRKITARNTTFTPDTVPNLRQCFVFILEDADPPAPSGARPLTPTDPASDERRSAARDEDPDASQGS